MHNGSLNISGSNIGGCGLLGLHQMCCYCVCVCVCVCVDREEQEKAAVLAAEKKWGKDTKCFLEVRPHCCFFAFISTFPHYPFCLMWECLPVCVPSIYTVQAVSAD